MDPHKAVERNTDVPYMELPRDADGKIVKVKSGAGRHIAVFAPGTSGREQDAVIESVRGSVQSGRDNVTYFFGDGEVIQELFELIEQHHPSLRQVRPAGAGDSILR